MTAPAAADHKRANEALAQVYLLLAAIGRRRRESQTEPDDEKQPAAERAA